MLGGQSKRVLCTKFRVALPSSKIALTFSHIFVFVSQTNDQKSL